VLQVVQQRNAQAEVEDSRRHIQELGQIRKQLQRELADVKDRLEAELAAKNEEASGSLFPIFVSFGSRMGNNCVVCPALQIRDAKFKRT
jgi:hypothetical protein